MNTIFEKSRRLLMLAAGLQIFSTAATAAENPGAANAGHPGAKVYREKCAECHGKNGEGVAGKHDEPLAGRRNVPALAKYISKTMPENNEGSCTGKDADDVAAYIYDAFYSPEAQLRNWPVREDLSRLTVEQYQNSVADLIGRFQGGFDRPMGKTHGLKGRYSGRFPVLIGPILKPRNDKERAERNTKERTNY